ncbi:hypothetical protein DFH06DRAFT_907694, partial [Mycena polygramma]
YKYAARQIVKQGRGGRIMGACSVCGLRGYALAGGYCISKAAVRSLTQTTDNKCHNITVNAYAPGAIDTDMTRPGIRYQESVSRSDPSSVKLRLMILCSCSTHVRTGKPADVAAVASFLASPHSHFVTGQ